MTRDYPGKFGLIASLPVPDRDGALKEIEYAYDTLKTDGISMYSGGTLPVLVGRINDRYPKDKKYRQYAPQGAMHELEKYDFRDRACVLRNANGGAAEIRTDYTHHVRYGFSG